MKTHLYNDLHRLQHIHNYTHTQIKRGNSVNSLSRNNEKIRGNRNDQGIKEAKDEMADKWFWQISGSGTNFNIKSGIDIFE